MRLIDEKGGIADYKLTGKTVGKARISETSSRVVFSAAHVVAKAGSANDPSGQADIDWPQTMAFRHHLHDHGLGIAEAMDTAQRGMGLDWPGALELIRQTRAELPDARVSNGVGTDQLEPGEARSLDDVRRAYLEQLEAVQKLDARVILMASRALARVATSPRDYIDLYGELLEAADHPIILHWLGPMFDPALAGYWGSDSFEEAMETVLEIISSHAAKVEGIKISLLDSDKEISLRERLPEGVRLYTGDDFNYPELIEGDGKIFSHALLGIFDPLAPLVASAIERLDDGDSAGFRAVLDPTVPLARELFRAPTQYYKTGVVFLAWLNGFQDHFIMLNGAQSMRPLPHFCKVFRQADECGLLRDAELAEQRMQQLMSLYGL